MVHIRLITLTAPALVGGIALSLAAPQAARADSITLQTVKVTDKAADPVGIVPFTDAIYADCGTSAPAGCLEVGEVDYAYRIGRLETTVGQYVKFLNTVDPRGTNKRRLYSRTESSSAWPKYGQINRESRAKRGNHYSVAYPQWAKKPYGFADFLRAARFVNSLGNGKVLRKRTVTKGGFDVTTYRVRLSTRTERGMYTMARKRTQRTGRTGFVVPSQDEWIKAAYYDPNGGGTYSYWKYPTNPGVFGDGTATQPNSTVLSRNGNVTNVADQPLATDLAGTEPVPTWCPVQYSPADECETKNPFGIPAEQYQQLYEASLSTIGQAATLSPWGTLDQGGNAVEWTDTITATPVGTTKGRVWRRLHGGVPNSTAYQLWLSAVGLQPENNQFFEQTYPWLGFRVGVIGKL